MRRRWASRSGAVRGARGIVVVGGRSLAYMASTSGRQPSGTWRRRRLPWRFRKPRSTIGGQYGVRESAFARTDTGVKRASCTDAAHGLQPSPPRVRLHDHKISVRAGTCIEVGTERRRTVSRELLGQLGEAAGPALEKVAGGLGCHRRLQRVESREKYRHRSAVRERSARYGKEQTRGGDLLARLAGSKEGQERWRVVGKQYRRRRAVVTPVATAPEKAVTRFRNEQINPMRWISPVAGEVGEALPMQIAHSAVREGRLRRQHDGSGRLVVAGNERSANMAK